MEVNAVRDKRLLPAVVMPFLIGMIGFFNLTRRPRFELFHTVDVLQLLATGMCFGIALAALLMIWRGKR
jgi:hypothetical protein